MRRESLLLLLLPAGFFAFAAIAAGGELPKLMANGPDPGERYSSSSTLGVGGSISPVFITTIRVEVFHVLDDGGLIRQSGCSFLPRENGEFGAQVEPPAAGWFPGRTRLRVSLPVLPQLKHDFDFEVLGPPALLPNIQPQYDPPVSDLVVRLPLDKVQVFDLPASVVYFVEGSYRTKDPPKGVQGPLLTAQLLMIRDDGSRVTCDGRAGVSFVQQDGSCWYQIQLQTPTKAGLYHFKIAALGKGVLDDAGLGPHELPFSIQVTEAARAKP